MTQHELTGSTTYAPVYLKRTRGALENIRHFRILRCIVTIADAEAPINSAYYPNFARYYPCHSTPTVPELRQNSEVREVLIRGGDEKLIKVLAEIDRTAGSEARLRSNGDG